MAINKKILIISTLLVSCNPLRDLAPTTEDTLSADFMDAKKPCPKPLYCYDTLTDTICYKTPLKDATHRLSGQPIPTFGTHERKRRPLFYDFHKEDPCVVKKKCITQPKQKEAPHK